MFDDMHYSTHKDQLVWTSSVIKQSDVFVNLAINASLMVCAIIFFLMHLMKKVSWNIQWPAADIIDNLQCFLWSCRCFSKYPMHDTMNHVFLVFEKCMAKVYFWLVIFFAFCILFFKCFCSIYLCSLFETLFLQRVEGPLCMECDRAEQFERYC